MSPEHSISANVSQAKHLGNGNIFKMLPWGKRPYGAVSRNREIDK